LGASAFFVLRLHTLRRLAFLLPTFISCIFMWVCFHHHHHHHLILLLPAHFFRFLGHAIDFLSCWCVRHLHLAITASKQSARFRECEPRALLTVLELALRTGTPSKSTSSGEVGFWSFLTEKNTFVSGWVCEAVCSLAFQNAQRTLERRRTTAFQFCSSVR
jgi:hypothetical protein